LGASGRLCRHEELADHQFEMVTDKDAGPAAGVADALRDNMIPHFNVYRPKDLSHGYCHPIITWGNGTGDQPGLTTTSVPLDRAATTWC
jgi:hypothetical protein